MALGTVLDPSARRVDDIAHPGPPLGALHGKTIGFRVDIMWRSWDWISELWAAELEAAGATVRFWRAGGRTGEEGARMAEGLKEFLGSIDAAIVGLGNCGSCTGWTIHDALAAAATDIPTIAIVTQNFDDLGHNLARRGGRSGLRIHVLPHPLNERARDEVEQVGREHYPRMLEAMDAAVGAAVSAGAAAA